MLCGWHICNCMFVCKVSYDLGLIYDAFPLAFMLAVQLHSRTPVSFPFFVQSLYCPSCLKKLKICSIESIIYNKTKI